MLKIIKVFSNNSVSTLIDGTKDAIVVGSGIGFHKRPNDIIDESRIEKIYYVQDELQTRFLDLLKGTRPEAIQASEEICTRAKAEGLAINDQLLITLSDHINFSLERLEKNITLPFLMLSEIRLLYPKEYEIAKWGLGRINELCKVELPELEIGYITMQIVSALSSQKQAVSIMECVTGIMHIIEEEHDITFSEEDLSTVRLITHLKFLAQRIFEGYEWHDDDISGLQKYLYRLHPENRKVINRVSEFLNNKYNYQISEQERVYLLVHLTRVINQKKEKRD